MKTTIKKSLSVVLAIVMVLTSVCIFSTGVFAAENKFTVTAASNIPELFPTATSTFDASTKQITVTYWYNLSNYDMVNSQWVLSYDNTALEYDETDGVNQIIGRRGDVDKYLIMRATNYDGTVINVKTDEGRIVGNCSKPGGYVVKEGRAAFISVTFNVVNPTKDTTVNLDLNIMQVRQAGSPASEKQVDFVKGGKIVNEDIDYVSTPTYSAVYGGTFEEDYVPDIKADNLMPYGVSVSFGESLSLNYYVLASTLTGYSNPYIEFTREGKTTKVTEYKVTGSYYIFTYRNVYPQLITDDVTGVIYAEKDGLVYYGNKATTSVKKYAKRNMDACAEGKTNADVALRTLLVDMLNYGAEAQKYRSYKINQLANADLTEIEQSWASEEPELKNVHDTKYEILTGEEKVKWYNVQVLLGDTVQLRPLFTTDDIANKTIEIKVGSRTYTYTEADFEEYSKGIYQLTCDTLYANDMSKDLFITAYDNGVQCSNVWRFSIESYVSMLQASGYNNMDLYMSMIKYGKAAEAYGAAK